jgi:AraC-like DNA-binding protein
MHDSPTTASRQDILHMRRDPSTGVEVLRARFQGHAYDMHAHDDEWLIGVTHYGVQDFYCRGKRQHSTAGRLILMEPGERHDGRSLDPAGFGYSMLYLSRHWLHNDLEGDSAIGFREPLAEDPQLSQAIRSLCGAIFDGDPRLTVEYQRDVLIAHLRKHLNIASRPRETHCKGMAGKTLAFLNDHYEDDISSTDLVAAAGAASRFQLNRAFKAEYGVSPHAKLIEIRLARARSMLRAKTAPAAVAAACGFADQSHLIRWFRRAYGLSPGAFSRGRTNLQSSAKTIG